MIHYHNLRIQFLASLLAPMLPLLKQFYERIEQISLHVALKTIEKIKGGGGDK